MSAIFNFCGYAAMYVTTGVTRYFYLDNHQSFCTQNYTLSAQGKNSIDLHEMKIVLERYE
jgi:hypothetical protein